MGFRIRVSCSGQNFWMILLMQSSQRGMKESRLDEVAREMVVGRMMGPTTSYMMFLQSKGSGDMMGSFTRFMLYDSYL